MKIEINLLSRKRKESKNKNMVFWMLFGSMFCFVAYFLISSIYVTYKLITLKEKLSAVNRETVSVSEDIRSKNELVSRYVLAKGILKHYDNLQKSKFRYKEYLDQIVKVLPSVTVLKNVDFSVKGWVSVSAFIPSYVNLEEFEDQLFAEGAFSGTWFESVYFENVFRDKTGGYTIKMQFSIKQNG